MISSFSQEQFQQFYEFSGGGRITEKYPEMSYFGAFSFSQAKRKYSDEERKHRQTDNLT